MGRRGEKITISGDCGEGREEVLSRSEIFYVGLYEYFINFAKGIQGESDARGLFTWTERAGGGGVEGVLRRVLLGVVRLCLQVCGECGGRGGRGAGDVRAGVGVEPGVRDDEGVRMVCVQGSVHEFFAARADEEPEGEVVAGDAGGGGRDARRGVRRGGARGVGPPVAQVHRGVAGGGEEDSGVEPGGIVGERDCREVGHQHSHGEVAKEPEL